MPSFWNQPGVLSILNNFNQALCAWPENPTDTVDPQHLAYTERLGNELHTVWTAFAHREAQDQGLHPSLLHPAVRWPFLNEAANPASNGLSDKSHRIRWDQGSSGSTFVHDDTQHPAMAIARWGSLSALTWLQEQGWTRRAEDLSSQDQHVHGVARLWGQRDHTGSLALLIRGLPHDQAGQHAMLWLGGAVERLNADTIHEVQGVLDLSASATPPFKSVMNALLSLEHIPQDFARAARTLDAMLSIAPWSAWRYETLDETLALPETTTWLNNIVEMGAVWAMPRWIADHAEHLPMDHMLAWAQNHYIPTPDAHVTSAPILRQREQALNLLEQHVLLTNAQPRVASLDGTIGRPRL